jgi:hypothetical protein
MGCEKSIQCVGWLGNVKERDHLEDLGVDRRIILKIALNHLKSYINLN